MGDNAYAHLPFLGETIQNALIQAGEGKFAGFFHSSTRKG